MDAGKFLLALGRRTQLGCNVRDPLAEARRIIGKNPDTGESQALRKVIAALATTRGEFSDSELWLFSAETCALVAALINARFEGRYSNQEWHGR